MCFGRIQSSFIRHEQTITTLKEGRRLKENEGESTRGNRYGEKSIVNQETVTKADSVKAVRKRSLNLKEKK